MKIAIIGSGIAGNVLGYHLHREHDITVFEAGGHVGGHVNTVDVGVGGCSVGVDTGFIVYNDRTYPRFVELLKALGVASLPTEMSFSVRCERSGLEYNGASLNRLFARRRNLLNPRFHRMIRDILRFYREAPAMRDAESSHTLGDFLDEGGYSPQFVEQHIVPMAAAIWSSSDADARRIPLGFFVRFFSNHGMLQLDNRPTWRVIRGGSRSYVDRLVAGFRDRILLRTPVRRVRRLPGHVEVLTAGSPPRRFDQVFFACHSDQALALLADASPLEREVLGAIAYRSNEAVLHTDNRLMPATRRAWAAWNCHLRDDAATPAVTYNMNILQRLELEQQLCVSLNMSEAIDPARVVARFDYSHPVFTTCGLAAQQRHAEVDGVDRTYFCGAYWRYGFHEDGVVSALNALQHFGHRQKNAELHLRRTG